jgi:hypothetical protein
MDGGLVPTKMPKQNPHGSAVPVGVEVHQEYLVDMALVRCGLMVPLTAGAISGVGCDRPGGLVEYLALLHRVPGQWASDIAQVDNAPLLFRVHPRRLLKDVVVDLAVVGIGFDRQGKGRWL